MQQRLGRDASDVQTRAAHFVLLNQSNTQTELAGTQGGSVAATSAAKDYKVKILFSQSQQLLGSGCRLPA